MTGPEPDPIEVSERNPICWRVEVPTTGTALDGGILDTPSRHDALTVANILGQHWGLGVVIHERGQWVCAWPDGHGGICGATDGQPHHQRHGEMT